MRLITAGRINKNDYSVQYVRCEPFVNLLTLVDSMIAPRYNCTLLRITDYYGREYLVPVRT
jgi:hypothetical protein